MPLKNLTKSTVDKLKNSTIFVFERSLIISLFCCITLSTINCKKLALLSGAPAALEQFFAENVLNRSFVINFASDNNTDITSTFSNYTFSFFKTNSFYEGTMTATKAGNTYSGTWSSNSDFSKLVLNITTPAVPAELVFLNRAWKFTQKDFKLMKLAPWDDNSAKVLHIIRL